MAVKKKRVGKVSRAADVANMVNSAMGKPVLKLGSDKEFIPVRVPSGSLVVDRVTGGGFMLGRHVEIYGDESACKTVIAYRTIGLSQCRGNLCAMVDPEKTFDPDWFAHCGGIPGELLLFQPEEKWNAEDAVGVMMILSKMMQEEFIEVIMVDSIAALVTQEEIQNDPREEDRYAPQARMMSRALRRLTTVNKRTLFIWTNQQRSNIGFGAQFNPHTQPGGRAMKFYATTRLELKRAGKIKKKQNVAEKSNLVKKEMPAGNWIQVRSEKDKSTRPYRQGMFIFDSDRGRIDLESEIIQLGLEDDIIERNGNVFSYEDLAGVEWKGLENKFKELIRENPDLQDELVQAISDMTVQLGRMDKDDG